LIGCFMRGVDSAGAVDPDSKLASAPLPGNSTQVGAVVGSRQLGQVQNHQHNWDYNFGRISAAGNDLNVQLTSTSPKGADLPSQITTNKDCGGAETRPVNVYAYFLIFTGLPQTAQQ
jgi:hypothetical protein